MLIGVSGVSRLSLLVAGYVPATDTLGLWGLLMSTL